MRTPRLYLAAPLSVGEDIVLPQDTVHYLHQVLRMKSGRKVWLFNGQGGEYLAEAVQLERRKGRLKVLEFVDVDRESPRPRRLEIALSKGDRFDWVIQKATELGVTDIQPLVTHYTDVRIDNERLEKRMAHWQGIVRSASEQSGRTRLPQLYRPVVFDAHMEASCPAAGSVGPSLKYVLDPTGEQSLYRQLVSSTIAADSTVRLLVGPEGGFSSAEIESANRAGYQSVTLGPRVLRTETAPVAALAVVQSLCGDWQS